MKVLMSTDCVGGVWTYALDLAKALRAHGVEVHLATMGAALSPEQRRDAQAIENVVLHESTYRLEWMADPWDDVRRAGEWLLELEHEIRADVVHLNGYAHGALPFRAPVVVVAHSCVLSWWEAVKGEPAPASWNRYRREVTAGIHDADLVVAPTRAMLDAAVKHYGPLPQTRVIPNGRDPSIYWQGRKDNFILTAGRVWDEAKNIAALREIADDLPWPVCVAGEETSPDGASADAGGLMPLGKLHPRALAGWFARADVYCLPALYEPFGLSALEAALSGCALVLGDIPSLREVWGDAATYVDPHDPVSIGERLIELIESPAERLTFARRARQRVAHYTPLRMGEGYVNAYQQLLRRRRSIEVDARIVGAFTPGAAATVATTTTTATTR
jgi:glycogen synthase